MKRMTLILWICTLQTAGWGQSVIQQHTLKDTVMLPQREVEKCDFEATKNGTVASITEQDGWIIEKGRIRNEFGAIYNEYAPAKDFYKIQKWFYPSGMMRTKTLLLGGVAIGIYEEYDEAGNPIKLVDEDKKFGKIKPRDVVEFLEKEGWFNRETGENKIARIKILPTTGEFYRSIINYIRIAYAQPQYSETGRSYWRVEIDPRFLGDITIYTIDGETGEFSKEEKYLMKYE
ncbi:hypothetical protein [Bacteroides heparinolyticus]|uniref:hypothetical protein n=1 Tax=Prevotella heparinolytica TaxID=28113 RepID=UPI0035A0D01A